MGMFDEIDYESICPVCREKVGGFQSKDGECILEHLKPKDVAHFYTSCGKCGCWIQFDRDGDKFARKASSWKGRVLTHMPEHDKIIHI